MATDGPGWHVSSHPTMLLSLELKRNCNFIIYLFFILKNLYINCSLILKLNRISHFGQSEVLWHRSALYGSAGVQYLWDHISRPKRCIQKTVGQNKHLHKIRNTFWQTWQYSIKAPGYKCRCASLYIHVEVLTPVLCIFYLYDLFHFEDALHFKLILTWL